MASQAIWLKLTAAAALLLIGHVLLTTKRFLVTEATKRRLDYDSAQSNKQLALKFQKEPDATLHDHLGDIYAALKQTEQARAQWELSLSIEPSEAIQKKLKAPLAKP